MEALNNSKKLFGIRTKLSCYKVFHRTFVGYRIKIIQILMNKPVYLDLQILEINKKVLHEFWYDYVKAKYVEDCVIWIMTVLLYT